MLIEDAMIVVTRFSEGLDIPEQELRTALPTVLLYAEMALQKELEEEIKMEESQGNVSELFKVVYIKEHNNYPFGIGYVYEARKYKDGWLVIDDRLWRADCFQKIHST